MNNQQYPYESLSGVQPKEQNVYDDLQRESEYAEYVEPDDVNMQPQANNPNHTAEVDIYVSTADLVNTVSHKATIWKLKVILCVLSCLLGVSLATNVAVLVYFLSSPGPPSQGNSKYIL